MKLGYFIEWLTDFYGKALQASVDEKVIFGTFFNKATLNANTDLTKRVICGYRIAGIDSRLTKKYGISTSWWMN